MPVADLIKEVLAKDLKKVEARLKKEKAAQTYNDPTKKGVFCSVLHKAVEAGSQPIVEALLKAGADINAVDNDGQTVLHWTSRSSDPAAVQLLAALLTHKPELALDNKPGFTPAHAAARNGDLGVLRVLAKTPSSLTAQDAEGRTPLMHLIAGGFTQQALELLDLGDCNLAGQEAETGYTALLLELAHAEPSTDLIQALLAAGASPDQQDSLEGDTAVTFVLKAGQIQLAQLLLASSKQVGLKNKHGESALTLALIRGYDEIAITLLSEADCLGKEGGKWLSIALDDRKGALASAIIGNMDIHELEQLGHTFENLAAGGCQSAAVAYYTRFESKHAEQFSAKTNGGTCLHQLAEASTTGQLLVQGLVDAGVPVNAVNKDGDTALHIAARCGHVEVCKSLFAAGADPMIRNNKNRKPREQLKIPDDAKAYLLDAEEEAKVRKSQKNSALWDDKMKATQTESAFGVRVC